MARRQTPPLKTNDHLLMQALQKLTGIGSGGRLQDYFDVLDEHDGGMLNIPCRFSRFIVVYEKIPLIHDVLFPKPSCFLLDVLGDAPEEPFLITDAGSASADGLYLVMQTESGDSILSDWLERAGHAKVIYNDHPRFGGLLAAALTSFHHA